MAVSEIEFFTDNRGAQNLQPDELYLICHELRMKSVDETDIENMMAERMINNKLIG